MIPEGVRQAGDSWIIFDASALTEPDPDLFSPSYWGDRIVGEAQGRGAALLIEDPALGSVVLRHYHRGGVPARVSPDLYFYPGLNRSRPFREWRILREAKLAGVPVPRPLAAVVHRHGLCYRGDILMERIPQADSLADLLGRRLMTPARWESLAQAVAACHRAGYWHADMNARNLLLRADQQSWWLIDFDRAEKRAPGPWAEGNLQRLRRSLDKLMAAGELSYMAKDWTDFIVHYRSVA